MTQWCDTRKILMVSTPLSLLISLTSKQEIPANLLLLVYSRWRTSRGWMDAEGATAPRVN